MFVVSSSDFVGQGYFVCKRYIYISTVGTKRKDVQYIES